MARKVLAVLLILLTVASGAKPLAGNGATVTTTSVYSNHAWLNDTSAALRTLLVMILNVLGRIPPASLQTTRTTVVRSVRLNKRFDQMLEEDSVNNRLSYNALIMKILTKYSEWDRFVEKIGFIQIPHPFFKNLVDAVPADRLNEISRELGLSVRENVRFWFKDVNLQTVLEFIGLIFRYAMGGSAQYDVRTDGRAFSVSVHHHLGEKWSRVFELFMSEAFKNSLGITPHFDLTDNDVIMKFTAPQL